MSGVDNLFQFVRVMQQSMKFTGKRRRRIIIAHTKILDALLNSTLNVVLSADAIMIMMFMNENDHTENFVATLQARYNWICGQQVRLAAPAERWGGFGTCVQRQPYGLPLS